MSNSVLSSLKSLKYYDFLVLASILMLWGALITTNMVFAKLTEPAETVKQAEAVVEVFEAAPVARIFLQSKQMSIIFATFVIPGLILGSYVFFRRRDKYIPYASEHVAWIFFFVAATDLLNDVSVLVPLLMSW